MIVGGWMFIAGVLLVMAGCGAVAQDRVVVGLPILFFGFLLGLDGVLLFFGLPMELP